VCVCVLLGKKIFVADTNSNTPAAIPITKMTVTKVPGRGIGRSLRAARRLGIFRFYFSSSSYNWRNLCELMGAVPGLREFCFLLRSNLAKFSIKTLLSNTQIHLYIS